MSNSAGSLGLLVFKACPWPLHHVVSYTEGRQSACPDGDNIPSHHFEERYMDKASKSTWSHASTKKVEYEKTRHTKRGNNLGPMEFSHPAGGSVK